MCEQAIAKLDSEYVKKNTGSNNYGLYREKSVQLADIIRKELEG